MDDKEMFAQKLSSFSQQYYYLESIVSALPGLPG